MPPSSGARSFASIEAQCEARGDADDEDEDDADGDDPVGECGELGEGGAPIGASIECGELGDGGAPIAAAIEGDAPIECGELVDGGAPIGASIEGDARIEGEAPICKVFCGVITLPRCRCLFGVTSWHFYWSIGRLALASWPG